MSLYPFPGFILICENIMRFLLITLLAKLPTQFSQETCRYTSPDYNPSLSSKLS